MQLLKCIFLLVIASALCQADKYLAQPPAALKQCNLNDANLNACFASNFQVLFREWKDGVPGLKQLGGLEPLQVRRVKIHQNSGPTLNLNADLENMVIYGGSQAVVKEAILDKQRFNIQAKVFLPKLRFECDYKAKGTVLALALNGQGKAFFETDDVILSFHITTKLRDEYGYTFTDIDTLKVLIESIGGFHVNVQNLFGGQRELEDSANELFNASWRDLYELLRPALEQTIDLILNDRFRKIYSYVPSNYFIANMPTAKEFYG